MDEELLDALTRPVAVGHEPEDTEEICAALVETFLERLARKYGATLVKP